MSDETTFLQAIVSAPDDDAPRLAYADYLTQRSDPRGEYIRVACRLAALPENDPQAAGLKQRASELSQASYSAWMHTLEQAAPGAWASFQRGFPDWLTTYEAEDAQLPHFTQFPTLRRVELHGTGVSPEGLRHLTALPLLERLDLEGLALTDAHLGVLAEMRGLRILSLNLDGLTAAGLAHLEALPELLVIRSDQEPGPSVAAALERIKHLRIERYRSRPLADQRAKARVVLENCGGRFEGERERVRGISLVQSSLSDADLEYVTAFPEVEELNLFDTRVTTAGLAHVAQLTNLRVLQLSKSRVTSLSALAGLTRLTQLEAWYLTDEQFQSCLTDEGTVGLEQLAALEELDLSMSAITDVTLHRIAALTNLRRLKLGSGAALTDRGLEGLRALVQLEELDLGSGSGLTNAGLAHLSGLTRLKVLRLRGQGIGDAGLVTLHGMRDLEYLEVYGTQVTPGAAERLLEVLPQLVIGVAKTTVKRVPEVVRFKRHDIDGQAAVALPQAWDVVSWKAYGTGKDAGFEGQMREDGYQHRGSYPGGAAPGEIWAYRQPAVGKSAADWANEQVDHDDPIEMVALDISLGRSTEADIASRCYTTSFGRKLLGVWVRAGMKYTICCEAPVARWALLEPIFRETMRSFSFTEDGPVPDANVVIRPNPAAPRRHLTPPEEALRQAIADAPEADEPRLRYADWLDTQGDPLGEFIRVQIEHACCADAQRRMVLRARERELREAHEGDWLCPVFTLGLTEPEYRAGLVEGGTVPATAFVDHAEEIFRAAPALHRLRLSWAGAALPALNGVPHLARLTELNLRFAAMTAEELADLLTSPHLTNLRELAACGNRLNAEAALALVRATHLRHLTDLDLCCNQLGDAGLVALAGAPHLASLTALDLAGNDITEQGVAALIASPYLTGLTYLNLSSKQLSAAALVQMAEAPSLAGLRELYLGDSPSDDAGLHALALSTTMTRLEVLSLPSGGWTDDGIVALANSGVVAGLTSLNLSCGRLTARGLTALARSPHLVHLRKLDVGGNQFGDEGIAALVESPLLERLTFLNVANTGLTSEGVRRLAESPALRNLRTLYLSSNSGGDAGLEALIQCPYLEQLECIEACFNEVSKEMRRAFRARFGDRIEHW